jgi:hypothetical protein
MGQWLVAACNLRLRERAPGKTINPKPTTIKGIESVRFCAFAPPGLPLAQYTLDLFCDIWVSSPVLLERSGLTAAQDDIESISQREFRLRNIVGVSRNQPLAARLGGNRT